MNKIFKTNIGKPEKRFDFLGYRLVPKAKNVVVIAWMTPLNHLDKLIRLYDRNAVIERIEEYIRGLQQWVFAG